MDPESIFNSFYDKIYSFTLLRVGNVHDAQDIVSNVFVKVAEKSDTYNPSIAAFSTWIFTIALNEIRMYFRGRKSGSSLDDIAEVAGYFNIEEEILRREEYTQLYTAIDALDDRQKDIVLMKYFGGLTDRQIAEIIGISEKNAGVILSRAKKKLRNLLASCRESDCASYKSAGCQASMLSAFDLSKKLPEK